MNERRERIQDSGFRIQDSACGIRHSALSPRYPASSLQHRAFHFRGPASSIQNPASRFSRAFTLLELLAVIIIIGILAGMILGFTKYAMTSGATSRTKSEIAAMEAALENYKNDYGAYPITPPGRPLDTTSAPNYGNSWRVYSALVDGSKKYMSFKPNQLQQVSLTETNIIDAFGTPYSYYCTAPVQADQTNKPSFDLWSYGPNGVNDEGNGDDICNWRR